jgi:hypothetical protein
VVIFARSDGKDQISIAYADTVTPAQAEQDFRTLAAQLGRPAVRPRISQDDPGPGRAATTSASGPVGGLVNWSTGVLQLDPVIATLKRFRHFKVTYLFLEKFDLTWPVGEQRRGPVRFKTERRGQTVTCEVWIDPGRTAAGQLPSTRPWALTWVWITAAALGACLATAGIFYLVYLLTRQRDAAPPP